RCGVSARTSSLTGERYPRTVGHDRRQPPVCRPMMSAIVTGLAGALLAAIILWDAFESVLVPRRIGRRVRLTRYFYIATWHVWRRWARPVRKTSRREMMLGLFAPLSQILLLAVWALGLITAFAMMQSAAAALGGVAP